RYGVQGDLRWAAIIAANPIEGDRCLTIEVSEVSARSGGNSGLAMPKIPRDSLNLIFCVFLK
ncbi:hypothetical protein CSKR_203302, partial [Clonorchis sinensis]